MTNMSNEGFYNIGTKNCYYNLSKRLFVVKFTFRADLVSEMKQMIPRKYRRYDGTKKEWVIQDQAATKLYSYLAKFEFTVASSAMSKFDELGLVPKQYEEVQLPGLKINIPLKKVMFPYQREGTAYCLEKKRVLIGDTQGLGKTIEAIAAVQGADAFPCLVVCPAHLKYNWKEEWEAWTDNKVVIMNENINRFPNQYLVSGYINVIVVNYESLMKYFVSDYQRSAQSGKVIKVDLSEVHNIFKSVLIDEIHMASNEKTQRFKILKKLTMGKEMVLALSGTPVKNRVEEMMNILRILGKLDDFGGMTFFKENYCITPTKDIAKKVMRKNNLLELQNRLKRICYFRREKHEVLKDLPDKFRQVIKIDIDNINEYTKAHNDFANYLKDYKQNDDAAIARAMKAEILVKTQHLMRISATGKLSTIGKFVRSTVDQDEKIVLFAHHKSVIETVHSQFPEFVKIVGGMKAEEKDKNVKAFQNNEDVKGIICSITAASTGLTLTASSKVAFLELPWTAEKTDQCEDRTHRIGQKDNVNAYYFIGNNTIDASIFSIIQSKRKLAMQVTGASDDAETDFIGDLLKAFEI